MRWSHDMFLMKLRLYTFCFLGELIWLIDFWVICPWNKWWYGAKTQIFRQNGLNKINKVTQICNYTTERSLWVIQGRHYLVNRNSKISTIYQSYLPQFFCRQKIDIVPTKLQQLLTRIYDHKKERRVPRKNRKEKPIKIWWFKNANKSCCERTDDYFIYGIVHYLLTVK